MEGLQPGFENLQAQYNNSKHGILQSLEGGFAIIWCLILGFLCWPFFIPMWIPGFSTWGIIIVTAIWWVLLGWGIRAWRRR